jgi:preprotein translocase subunit SecA
MEDELMKRFGGDRVKGIMERLNMPEDQPIEHRMISGSIQQAQVRVEGYNFDLRKRVLEYDDVVNKQRLVIYKQRDEILAADTLREQIEGWVTEEIDDLVETHLPDPKDSKNSAEHEHFDTEKLYQAAVALFPIPETVDHEQWEHMAADEIKLELTKAALTSYQHVEDKLTPEIMRIAERQIMLQVIDRLWVRHLTDLDVLREGIGLVAIAQRDPLVEYKREAFQMWEELQAQIQRGVIQLIFRVELAPQAQSQLAAQNGAPAATLAQANTIGARNIQARQASLAKYLPREDGENGQAGGPPRPVAESAPEPIRATEWDKVGRNDPCPCGSGKKFKNCHYPIIQAQRATNRK